MRLPSPLVTGIVVPVLFLFLLEALISANVISRFAIPLPSSVLSAIPTLVRDNNLLGRFANTLGLAVLAGALICVIGVALGVLFAKVKWLGRTTEPLVGAFAAAPLILAYPIFLVFFGRSFLALVAFALVGGLAPVILKTREGLNSVRPVFLNVARSLRLTRSQTFFKIELPAALPTIFTGVRLGFVFGLIHLIAFEFLLNFGGLGGLVAELAELYNPTATWAAITFVIGLSAFVFFLLERAQQWIR